MGPGVTENPIQLYGLHRLPVQVEELLGRRFAIDWNESDRNLPLDTLVRLGTEYDGLVTTVTDRIPAPVFDAPGRRAFDSRPDSTCGPSLRSSATPAPSETAPNRNRTRIVVSAGEYFTALVSRL